MRKLAGVTAVANVIVVAIGLVVLAVLPSADSGGAGRVKAPARPRLPVATLPAPVPATVESARKVQANELGKVPVLMYHRIQRKRSASIDRTPAQLKAELEKLATRGFVPITAAEFVAGAIDIPAGSHPVVLTFDDGNPTHFALDASGLPKKDTAVGIIYDVAAKHPSFRPVATFWVNREPFGLTDEAQQAAAVRWLLEHGFEVANHSYGHPDLRRLTAKQVKEQIVRQERLLKKFGVPSSTTFALPFGSQPGKRSLAQKGSWDGTSYKFDGVFLAGAEPSVSPFHEDFDRRAIQRIQSNGTAGDCRKWCSTYWLEWFKKHPGELYTADGDPDSLSLPKQRHGDIGSKRPKRVIEY
ncbi:polysaccharide deacetylase family protein [Acrocarpospora phusangensis]|uniref:polysaccharide deacetylase family protein n=1 Tax=Acrocarpospora phusangensis TaxID=1070424 RepID=UPI001EF2DE0A|nr:polysaccharide deacetylase family protein [Acrocarpospora phusangensis]